MRCSELETQVVQGSRDIELERYRAVEVERSKWEAREERLVRQLEQLEERLEAERRGRHRLMYDLGRGTTGSVVSPGVAQTKGGESSPEVAGLPTPKSSLEAESNQQTEARSTESPKVEGSREVAPPKSQAGGGDAIVAESSQSAVQSSIQAALLAQQMPPLPKFSGENRETEGETFQDWMEQFELVATMCGWNEQDKPVNLATRLKGQAYVFYQSCTSQQHSSYATLVAELSKRFTPLRIKAVQSSLFHERKQGLKETVDDYAQGLRRLFY